MTYLVKQVIIHLNVYLVRLTSGPAAMNHNLPLANYNAAHCMHIAFCSSDFVCIFICPARIEGLMQSV